MICDLQWAMINDLSEPYLALRTCFSTTSKLTRKLYICDVHQGRGKDDQRSYFEIDRAIHQPAGLMTFWNITKTTTKFHTLPNYKPKYTRVVAKILRNYYSISLSIKTKLMDAKSDTEKFDAMRKRWWIITMVICHKPISVDYLKTVGSRSPPRFEIMRVSADKIEGRQHLSVDKIFTIHEFGD